MIIKLLERYGLLAEFLIVACEYACLPIPSEVVLPFVGAMAATFQRSLVLIIAVSVLGGLLGSLICYYIGYIGGEKLLNKVKNKKGYKEAIEKYQKYSSISVCLGRLVPICRTYISFIAGISKQNVKKYAIYSIIGIFIWNSFLVILGYAFFENLQYISVFINKFKLYILILFTIVFLIYFIVKIFKRKRGKYERNKKLI